MANGPPTPPPTTAVELIDEAREKALNNAQPAPAAELQQTQPLGHDPFQAIFPTITSLAAQGKFQELIQTAEQTEINNDGDRYHSRLLVIAPLVLAYLILDDLPPAYYALTRLHDNALAQPLCQSLLSLLASTWERKHAMVYSRAENLHYMVEQSDFVNAKLIMDMVTTFVESFRHRSFVLLSKAYSSMPLSLARTYLGLPDDQLLTICEGYNWSYDASTQILIPASSPKLESTKSEAPASSLNTFFFVADSVTKLEI